jgi:hypothetical protein
MLRCTELCSFQAKRRCRKGSLCTFAHHEGELRPKPDFRHTRLCRDLASDRGCTRGTSCLFAHSGPEAKWRNARLKQSRGTPSMSGRTADTGGETSPEVSVPSSEQSVRTGSISQSDSSPSSSSYTDWHGEAVHGSEIVSSRPVAPVYSWSVKNSFLEFGGPPTTSVVVFSKGMGNILKDFSFAYEVKNTFLEFHEVLLN